jgi:transcriptional regulator with XRE-family HTH domain
MRRPTPLKRAIFDRQLVQKDLAARLGIDPGHLSRIVNGGPCSQELAERLADMIGEPIADLFPEFAGPAGDNAAHGAAA